MDKILDNIISGFLSGAGRTTQEFGLGRLVGQVYFLLLFSKDPLCLDDIAKALGVSKASASNTVRALENWKAVRRIWVKGDRKDYFMAEEDFSKILDNGLFSQFRRKLETVDTEIREAQQTLENFKQDSRQEDPQTIEFYKKRLNKLKKVVDKAKLILNNPLLKKWL